MQSLAGVPDEVDARVRRYRARLRLPENQIHSTIETVDPSSRIVLLVDAFRDLDATGVERALRHVVSDLHRDADLIIVNPEFTDATPSRRLGRRSLPTRASIVRALRAIGWTPIAVERFAIDSEPTEWVDVMATVIRGPQSPLHEVGS